MAFIEIDFINTNKFYYEQKLALKFGSINDDS